MKLTDRRFKTSWDLTEWVNKNIEVQQVLSITFESRSDEYVLFYKEVKP